MGTTSTEIAGVEICWDADSGSMSFYGIPASTFWLNPSLLRMLTPLRDEMGSDLFSLLIAQSSSLGTDEDYHTIVTVLGETFEEGFLAWGHVVGAAGWGRFELPHFDREACEATVVIRSPWELVMQESVEDPWGCPFLRGKMIGLFNHALGHGCWADERSFEADDGEQVVEISIYASEKTIDDELEGLREELARERARALQDEVARLAEQLQQAQKMEAIGQLTGGIAHDFNNLLTVIHGNLELIGASITDQRATDAMQRARSATRSAATLTRRLLAFSRKQPLSPQSVDLAELVVHMEGLLKRSLTESIQVKTITGPSLWACHVDAAQLEASILNLAINARDAMPLGGTLTIEAANARLNEAHAAEHGIPPGDYVMLAVTDTGSGMAPEVLEQAFEPFFTTKEVGEGSGLGLSMVYGFVNQSNGHIDVRSQVGHGTSFEIYLPRGTFPHEAARPTEADDHLPLGQGERILVVEDSSPVRAVTVVFLERLGYVAVEAATAAEALSLLRGNQGLDDDVNRDVALLLTDVILPGGVSGIELARKIRGSHPELPVLYVSGYAGNEASEGARLDPATNLLAKPFTERQLARRVAALLRRGD
ncbi:MAG: hybrid sensor histidine kinase/response regulator [Deltaproteobacteria bacterium]|nr:MAG: hybrid sensor histidine kinase/response regulator [Deltaproteobacteria bacterium]